MQFIPTRRGDISLSKVSSIQHRKDAVVVSYEEGGEVYTTTADMVPSAVDKYLGEIIPATPGYEALELCACEEYCPDVCSTPIIAWRILGDIAIPIGVDSVDEEAAIRAPDGQVFDPGLAAYDDVDGWREAIFKKRRQKAAASK